MNSPTNLEAIQEVLQTERVLDGIPGEYKIKLLHADFETGAAAVLKQYYRENLLDVPGRLVVGTVEITMAPEVTAVLRSLLYTGCCRIEARSIACREIFMRGCRAGTHIGKEELLSTFVEGDLNPFVDVLQTAIKELFDE